MKISITCSREICHRKECWVYDEMTSWWIKGEQCMLFILSQAFDCPPLHPDRQTEEAWSIRMEMELQWNLAELQSSKGWNRLQVCPQQVYTWCKTGWRTGPRGISRSTTKGNIKFCTSRGITLCTSTYWRPTGWKGAWQKKTWGCQLT